MRSAFLKRNGLFWCGFMAVLMTLRAQAGLNYFTGTGHWYEAVYVSAGITWNEAYTNAVNRGGYLCSITNSAENTFVAGLVDISYYSDVSVNNDILGPWLGGIRHANESQWQWLSGEAFSYSNWHSGQPDGYGGTEQRLQFYNGASIGATWGDHPGDPISGYSLPRGYIVEYDQLPQLKLAVTNQLPAVFWPLLSQGWVLESSPVLTGDTNSWSTVSTNYFQTNAVNFYLPITNQTGAAFFRLRH